MAISQGVWAAIVAAALTVAPGAPAQQPTKPAAKPAESAKPAEPAKPEESAKPAEAGKPAPPKHKHGEYLNLKVLNNVPPTQMFDIMMVMRASLGVRCDYCHVIEGDRYELDTKPAKQTSRDMIQMVRKLNQDYFAGETVVSCETCHHGQITPPRAPSVALGFRHEMFPGEPLGGPSEIAVTDLPSATEVLDHYIEALGGRAALEGVRSRVSRGTLLRLGIVKPDTPEAHAGNRTQQDPLEVVQRLPDKISLVYGPPDAQVVQNYDSKSGSIKSPKGPHDVPPAEAAKIAARYDLRKDLKLSDRAESARVLRREKIDGQETYVVETTSAEGYPAHLFFDVKSGLLRRQITYQQTVIGPAPEQTDYEDYRAVDGVKVPFLTTFSPLDDLHFGLTRKMAEVHNNVE